MKKKIKVPCKTCGGKVEVKRCCKIIDGCCSNIEDDIDGWNFISWCSFPCTREGGQLLSNAEEEKRKKEKEAYREKLNELRQSFDRKNTCAHPRNFVKFSSIYNYGDIHHFHCLVCNKRWRKEWEDSRGLNHDYGRGA
ncbi:hypothetical protein H8E88_19375 [candidate division KSB1 bacterium]|nr:hypothetical protein [candidate division KSB1 bacterium]